MQKKERAGRNRTLCLSDGEISDLEKRLLSLESLKAGGEILDKTLNSGILESIEFVPDEFADLIIIDPPYNLNKDFNGNVFRSMDDSSYEAYVETWFPSVCKKLKSSGSLYMCGDWKCTAVLQRVLERHLSVLNRITWQREKGRGAKSNWKNAMEDIWFAVKNQNDYYFDVKSVMIKRKVIATYKVNGKPKDWDESEDGNFRLTYPSNFWDDISIPFWSMPENTAHPTQKPEKLIAKMILASSNMGDVVFDPFLGSGTTSVTAKKLGRKYVGIELDETYCAWAEKRLEMADDDSSIQGYTDGVFWERNTLGEQKKVKENS